MTTLLAFAFVISVLVMVHELGHHLMAKWFGVPVEVFAIGFGPRLIGVRFAGTEYRICAIPFGGYVKMAGTSLRKSNAPAHGFDSKSPWQRFVILLAGPVMNIAFALALTTIALWCGIELPAYRSGAAVIGAVVENSAAERAGLKAGDRILAVSGRAVSSWSGFENQLTSGPSASLVLLRGEQQVEATVATIAGDAIAIGIVPDAQPVIRSVARGSAAERSGIQAGDIVAAIDGRPATLTTNLDELVAESDGRVMIAVVRDGKTREVAVAGAPQTLGVEAAVPTALFWPEPLDAFALAGRAIMASTVQILSTVSGLMTGEVSARHLIGPVGLAQIAGESSRLGWRALLAAMAFISLNLGLCNLLPIPILDGGHMLMLLVEGVTRRTVPFQMKKALLGAGAVAMLLLLATTFYNDLGRLGWLAL